MNNILSFGQILLHSDLFSVATNKTNINQQN